MYAELASRCYWIGGQKDVRVRCWGECH